jgi:hypothetical protein
LPVNGDAEHPLVINYLDRTLTTIQTSLDEYPRTFALRFDLRYPSDLQDKASNDGTVIKTFINSLKAKITADRKRSAKQGRSNNTKVRYVWCKEVSRGKHCHFHFLILLNNAAYHQRGKLDSVNMNTARRIETAWEAALNKHWLIYFIVSVICAKAEPNPMAIANMYLNAVGYKSTHNKYHS